MEDQEEIEQIGELLEPFFRHLEHLGVSKARYPSLAQIVSHLVAGCGAASQADGTLGGSPQLRILDWIEAYAAVETGLILETETED